jgi:tRNA A37 N6-isopentenylltransferase MiaA
MYIKAIKNLYNGRFIAKSPYTYSEIQWLDENITAPTDAEIQAEVARLQAEYEATQYKRNRAAEYPDFKDYLDGIVKGDTAQVQAYIDACNAVKAKYPKG